MTNWNGYENVLKCNSCGAKFFSDRELELHRKECLKKHNHNWARTSNGVRCSICGVNK